MSRDILFRGKRKDNGKWIEGFYYKKPNPHSEDGCPVYHGISDVPPFGAEVIPKTVGQYTGFTDKNGNKIFEGDILSTENGTFSNTGMGHICLYKGMWVSFYGQDAIGRDQYDELYMVCILREVIGNIHDNPELLEV